MRKELASALVLLLLASPASVFAQEAESLVDTDGDGLSDRAEDADGDRVVDTTETDPRDADTDGGGEADGSEVKGGRNPLLQSDDMTFDQDGDGLSNAEESALGSDPVLKDTDNDGTLDGLDPFPKDDSYRLDADKDKLPDEWEGAFGLSSKSSGDTSLDSDGDGLGNLEEFQAGTNPLSNDTDRDGITDAQELAMGGEPSESACLSYGGNPPALSDLTDHWAKDSVEQLQRTLVSPFAQPVLRGYEIDGKNLFLPDRAVTRFELLKIALFSTCIGLLPPEEFGDTAFSDVAKRGRPHEAENLTINRRVIYTALRLGIVQGYEDGSFRPDAAVTRAEALKILLASSQLALHPSLALEYSRSFSDVSPSDWFAEVVDQAVKLDLVEGYEDSTFRPHASITRAEAAKITHFILLQNPLVNGYVLPQGEDDAETGTGQIIEA
jgi:S-layer homology domain/Bacterial TSP3 repeat